MLVNIYSENPPMTPQSLLTVYVWASVKMKTEVTGVKERIAFVTFFGEPEQLIKLNQCLC